MLQQIKTWWRGRGWDERGLNVRLLKKVERYIRKHPERYSQNVWWSHPDQGKAFPTEQDLGVVTPEMVESFMVPHNGPVCGTKGCVAGTALMLSHATEKYVNEWGRTIWLEDEGRHVNKTYFNVDWQAGAQDELGLSKGVAEWLFSSDRDEGVMPDVLAAIRKGEVALDVWELSQLEGSLSSEDIRVGADAE